MQHNKVLINAAKTMCKLLCLSTHHDNLVIDTNDSKIGVLLTPIGRVNGGVQVPVYQVIYDFKKNYFVYCLSLGTNTLNSDYKGNELENYDMFLEYVTKYAELHK